MTLEEIEKRLNAVNSKLINSSPNYEKSIAYKNNKYNTIKATQRKPLVEESVVDKAVNGVKNTFNLNDGYQIGDITKGAFYTAPKRVLTPVVKSTGNKNNILGDIENNIKNLGIGVKQGGLNFTNFMAKAGDFVSDKIFNREERTIKALNDDLKQYGIDGSNLTTQEKINKLIEVDPLSLDKYEPLLVAKGGIYSRENDKLSTLNNAITATGAFDLLNPYREMINGTTISENEKGENVIDSWFGKRNEKNIDDKITKLQEEANENTEKVSNDVLKYTANLAPSIGNNASSMLISTINPLAGTLYFTGSASNSYALDGKEMGLSDDASLVYGTILGILDGQLEKIGVENFKKGTKEMLKGSAKEAIKKYAIDMADNYIQEALMEPVQETANQLFTGKSNWNGMLDRMNQAGISGAVSSAILGGTTGSVVKGINTLDRVKVNNQVRTEIISKIDNNKYYDDNLKNTLKKAVGKLNGNSLNSLNQNLNILDEVNNGIDKTNIEDFIERKLTNIRNIENLQQAKISIANEIVNNKSLSDHHKSLLLNMTENTNDLKQLNIVKKYSQAKYNNENINNVTQEQVNKITENYVASANANNIDVNNVTVQSMLEIATSRGFEITYDKNAFNNSNQGAKWTIDENGNRKVFINPNVNNETSLQNLTIHELTHDLEKTKDYKVLSDLVLDFGKQRGLYNTEVMDDLKALYATELEGKTDIEQKALIESEAVANILGAQLGNQEFVNHLVFSNRQTANKLYNWVVDKLNKLNKLTGYKFEKLYWADVKNKFDKAFKADFNNYKGESKYHISSNLSEDIDKVFKGEYDVNMDVKLRDYTPEILVKLGLENLPMLMNQSHLKENILSKTKARKLGIFNEGTNYHNLGKSLFMDIIDSLDSPLMVMKSISPTGKNNSWVIVTDVKNQNGEQIIVPIFLNTKGNFNNIEIDTNKIKSIYGKNNIQQLVNNTIKGDLNNLLYLTKDTKKRKLFTTIGLQLSNHSNTSTTNSISQNAEKVNYVNTDNKGRQLTQEQQEYFKDSKIRDEHGNLLEVYHTTENDFNIFEADKMGKNTGEKINGIYMSKIPIEPGGIYGDRIIKLYANITNPVEPGMKNITKNQFYELIKDHTNSNLEEAWARYKNADDLTILESINRRYKQNKNYKNPQEFLDNVKRITGYDGAIYYGNRYYGDNKTAYVAFNSNQVKNVDNTTPTNDADIRYSKKSTGAFNEWLEKNTSNKETKVPIKKQTTETKGTLQAVHNLSAEKLQGLLDLGGIPVPSIAITNQPHTQFGDISLIFDKSTIDPSNYKNEVYDRDVWSPTFPQVDYVINDKEIENVSKNIGIEWWKLNDYAEDSNSPEYLVEKLLRNEDVIDKYIKDNNLDYKTEYKDSSFKRSYNNTEEMKEWVNKNKITLEKLSQDEKLAKKYLELTGLDKDSELYKTLENSLFWYNKDHIMNPWLKSLNNDLKILTGESEASPEIDEYKTRDNKKEVAKNNGIENYLKEQVKNIFGEKGIRNDIDTFTLSGNRRSFWQLHDKYNLSNLVKALTNKATKASQSSFLTGFGKINAQMSKQFESIEDIKNNESRLIKDVDNENLESYREIIGDDVGELANYYKYANESFNMQGFENASESIFDLAKSGNLEESNFRKILKENIMDAEKVPSDLINKIITDLNNLKELGTDYFEAKPQRAVSFDEVKAVVVPNNIDSKLKQQLLDRGMNVIEYDPEIEGDREAKISSLDQYKFSKQSNGKFGEWVDKNTSNEGTQTKVSDVLLPENIRNIKDEIREKINTTGDLDTELKKDLRKLVDNTNDEKQLKKYLDDINELNETSNSKEKTFVPIKGTIKINNYKNAKINQKIVDTALDMVKPNRQGNRTKDQWLQVAEQIGLNAPTDKIDVYANKTWLDLRPYDSLNKQGKRSVYFKKDDWINAVNKGAETTIANIDSTEVQNINKVLENKDIVNDAKDNETLLNEITGKETRNKVKEVVKDSSGKPLEVYHGTPVSFDKFDSTKAGTNTNADFTGMYFTDNADVANDFSYEQLPGNSNLTYKRGNKGNIYKANLLSSNSLDLNHLTNEDIEGLRKYLDSNNILDSEDNTIEMMKKMNDANNIHGLRFYLDLSKVSKDYDMVISDMGGDYKGSNEYIVFDESQISKIDDNKQNSKEKFAKVPIASMDKQIENMKAKSDEKAQQLLRGVDVSIKRGTKNSIVVSNDNSVAVSKHGNLYFYGTKPTAKDYIRTGLDATLEKGTLRLVPKEANNVDAGLKTEEWTGEKWEDYYEVSNKRSQQWAKEAFEDSNESNESPTLQFIKDARNQDKATIKQVIDAYMQKIVNSGHYIDQLADKVNNPELKYANDKRLSTYGEAQYSIGVAQTDINGNEIGKSLIDIFKPVEQAGLKNEFNDYLLNRLNIERQAVEKAIFGDEITSQKSRKIIRDYEEAHPEFKEWAQDVYTFNRNELQNLVDAGLVSKDTQELFRKMYGDYVPVHRILEEVYEKGNKTTKETGVSNPVKRAKGGYQEILDIETAMAENVLSSKKAIAMNELGKQLAISLGHKNILEDMGYEPKWTPEAIMSLNGDVVINEDGKYLYTIYTNGEMKQFALTKELYEGLRKDTIQNKINNSKIAKRILDPFEKATKLQRDVLTTYSVGFLLNNPIKDFQDGLFYTKYSAGQFLKNYSVALKEIATKGKYYKQYMALGGQDNSFFEYGKGIKQEAKGLKKVLAKIEQMNSVLETAPRLAEFISSIENGASVNEAMYNASDITTNFKRGGEYTKLANKYGMNFLNASVQGFDKFMRTMKVTDAKSAFRLVARVASMGILPALLNGFMYKDDDDYEKLEDYIKDEYYLIKLNDDGDFLRIPKGRVLATISSATRTVIEGAKGDLDLKSFTDEALKQLAPGNPLENNILAPVLQAYNNKTWYGTDLVPKRLQNQLPKYQYNEKTDKISMWLGENLNISPIKINYLIDQYSGGFGDLILPMLTPQAENNIITDKFTTNAVMKNKTVGEFYDALDKYEKLKNAPNATEEDTTKYAYLSKVSSKVSKLYAQKREIQMDSSLSDKEKKELVKDVQREINAYTECAMDLLNGEYNEDTKWNMYTEGIISDKVRESDGNSALQDALYIVNNGLATKGEYMDMYQKAKENNTSLPTMNKLVEMKNNNVKLTTYTDFMIGTKEFKADRDEDDKAIAGTLNAKKATYIMDMDATKEQKNGLLNMLSEGASYDDLKKLKGNYTMYFKQSGKRPTSGGLSAREKYMSFINAGINPDQLDAYYTGISQIKGSNKKQAVFNFINSLKLTVPQKMMLLAKQYKNFRKLYVKDIVAYIKGLKVSKKEKIKMIYSIFYS